MSSDVLPSVRVHPTEDLLEEYSFGRICEPELASIEDHLLMCPLCQSKLLAVDEYRALMKSGIAAFEREERQASFGYSPRFAFPRIPTVNILLGAAVMLVFVSAIITWRMLPATAVDSQAATVRLIALRGTEVDGAARAPAGRRLDLVIDRKDLPPSLSYHLEMVSIAGRQLWSGTAQIVDQDISARVTGRFKSGIYWVRLYSGDQLLREFGLHIE